MPTYANPFYEIAGTIEAIAVCQQASSVEGVFTELIAGLTARQARLRFIKLFDDAIELIAFVQLPEERLQALSEALKINQERAIFACASKTTGEFMSEMGGKLAMVSIAQMGDAVASGKLTDSTVLDKDGLLISTRNLVDDVRASPIPEYAKRVLELKLSALSRILVECDHYSDDEIRRRVKAIYADFCAEFDMHDKAVMPLREKMKCWAVGVSKPGVLALALSADVSGVAGFLQNLS